MVSALEGFHCSAIHYSQMLMHTYSSQTYASIISLVMITPLP